MAPFSLINRDLYRSSIPVAAAAKAAPAFMAASAGEPRLRAAGPSFPSLIPAAASGGKIEMYSNEFYAAW